jgi:MFS family permease
VRKLVLLVGAVVFVDTLFFSALTPLLPRYAEELGLGRTGAGVLAASYPAGALLGALPGGIAAARLGVKPTVLAGLVGMTVTTLAFGFATDIYVLDATRFLQGFASAFSWTASLSWLVAAAPPQRRGELIGMAVAAAVFGALFGPVLGGAAALTSPQAAFSVVAVLGAGLALWAWRTPAAPPGEPQPLRALVVALRDARVAASVWLVALPALLFGVLGVLGPLRLDELGFGAIAIGATWLLAAGLEAIASPLLGRLSDRRGRLLPLRGALVASAAVAFTIPWLGSAWALAAVVVAAGVSFGAFWTPAMSLLADSAEARGLEYAYGFALINIAWAPSAALGAAGGGALAHLAGDEAPFLLLAVACVATLILLPRPARRATKALARPHEREPRSASRGAARPRP